MHLDACVPFLCVRDGAGGIFRTEDMNGIYARVYYSTIYANIYNFQFDFNAQYRAQSARLFKDSIQIAPVFMSPRVLDKLWQLSSRTRYGHHLLNQDIRMLQYGQSKQV